MNAVKDSFLVRQHDPAVEEVTILYTDLRAFGKGFDDFVKRVRLFAHPELAADIDATHDINGLLREAIAVTSGAIAR